MDSNEGAPQSLQKTLRGCLDPLLNLLVSRGGGHQREGVTGVARYPGALLEGFSQTIVPGGWGNSPVGIVHWLNILGGYTGDVEVLGVANGSCFLPLFLTPPQEGRRFWVRRGQERRS